MPLSVVVSGSLGGLVGDLSWRSALLVFGGCSFLVWLLLCLGLREPERQERAAGVGLGETGATLWGTLAAVLSTPSFLLLALAYIVASTINQLTLYWLPRYFYDLFRMTSLAEAGWMATAWSQIGTVIGLVAGGWLADRWCRWARSGRFAVQLIGLVVTIPALQVMGVSEDRFVLCVAMLVYGIGINFYLANLWTTTFEVVDPAARATAIGLLNVATGLFGVWVSPAIGYWKDQGHITSLGQVFTGSAAATIVAALLLTALILLTLRRDYRGSTL
jgi:MFS family permease